MDDRPGRTDQVADTVDMTDPGDESTASTHGPDPEAVARAARLPARIAGQCGVVTAAQALAAGYTIDRLKWQVRSGRWTRLHRGVYLTTPGRGDWEMHAVAALLAVGPPCALGGASAGKAWGLTVDPGWSSDDLRPTATKDSGDLPPEGQRAVSVVVPFERSGLSRPGISVSRRRNYPTLVHDTSWPPRMTAEHTVLDLALEHGPDRAIALMAKACQLRIATESSISAALKSRSRQPHRELLLEALGLVGEGAESAAEVRYIRDVELAHGLPIGIRQEPAPGSRHRDSAYPDQAVVVEIDGRLGHVGWTNQQRAGRRDRKAAVGGKLTVRAGWTDVAVTPCEFAVDLAAIFATRGWSGRPTACESPGCNLRRDIKAA